MADATIKHISAEGLEVDVDMARMNSWRATKLLAKTAAAKDDQTKAAAFIAYLDFALGEQVMDAIENAAGGDLASSEDVLGLASKVLAAAAKNS